MFLVLTVYKKPAAEIDRFLPAHAAFLDKYYARRKIIFSGRRNPRTGGLILFNAATEAEVWSIMADDPFRQNGITECELIEFTPTKYDGGFAQFVCG